jgi:hypothetical protein
MLLRSDTLAGIRGGTVTITDARTLRVLDTVDPGGNGGIRPFQLTRDETTIYARLSFLPGFVE